MYSASLSVASVFRGISSPFQFKLMTLPAERASEPKPLQTVVPPLAGAIVALRCGRLREQFLAEGHDGVAPLAS